MSTSIALEGTALTRARYNRVAPIYTRMERLTERDFRPLREELWTSVSGEVLEVGVGTGQNMPYYPEGARVTGIDLADRMLARARERAGKTGARVDLREGDVQQLAFRDNSFDMAVATCVFCSVPDPVQGLRELGRVVKPGGRILLLEHTRIERPVIGRLMDWMNPFVVRLWGANINRRTVENVEKAGLQIESVKSAGMMKMHKLIVARPAK